MRDNGWFKRRFKQVSFATIVSSVAIATLQTYQLHQSSSLASHFEADPDEHFLSSSSSSLTETALNRHDNDDENDVSDVQKDLTEAVRQATRLLYEESPRLDYWLEQPLPKIYVYDTLDDAWTNVTRISSCVDDNMLALNDSFREHDTCRWYPRVCSDDSNTKRRFQGREYTSWRYNFNTDVALVELFRGYPARSYDPHEEADDDLLLYVIPFPYLSQCYCQRGRDTFWDFGTRCPFGLADIQTHVLSRLPYYNANTKSRHLWILGCDWKTIKAPRFIRTLRQGISLSLGASELCVDSDSHCPLLLHPYLNTKETYQPHVLMDQPFWQEEDNNENLRYSMYGAFGTPAFLPYRRRFYKEFSQLLPQNGQTTTIGGLPAQMLNLGEGRRTEMLQRMELTYQQSVFCLILPGDSPVQKRFFDVLLNGCIPLMPTWPSNSHHNKQSSWAPNGPAISVTYPFAPVHFRNDPFAGIHYEQNVLVTFDGECGVPCAQQAIERVMSNQTELRRLRANVKKYAPLFAFGLDKNAYRYNDAFAAILVNLRHHVTTLMELQTKSKRTSTP